MNLKKGLSNPRLYIQMLCPILLIGVILSSCATPGAKPTASVHSTQAELSETKKPSLTQTASPVPSATVPVELSSLKGTEIQMIHPWSGATYSRLKSMITEFNNENIWGIRVNEIQGGSVTQTARLFTESMVTSNRINLIAISPEYLAGWNSGGYTIDLTPFISNSEWGIPDKEKSTYFPDIWQSNHYEDVQIGIPAQINLHILAYNESWAEELGYDDPPRTRDEFLNQICEAARTNNQDSNRENDGTGGWIINANSSTLLSWINSFSGKESSFDSPDKAILAAETGEAYVYLRSLTEKGCAWNSRVASPFTYFSTRQTMAFSATLPDLLELEQTLRFAENNDEWSILAYPGYTSNALVYGTGISYGISKTDAVSELASWLFLRWMTLPRNQARLAETAGTIPPTTSAVDLMSSFSQSHPWWATAKEMVQDVVFIQTSPDWRKARPVLEDGFWQMLQPTPMPVPTLLHQMSETYDSFPE